MKTIAYNNGKAICPKCGGDLSYDASVTRKLPVGLGFMAGDNRFRIDYAISKGWRGQCIECLALVFAVVSTKHAVKHPRSINRKLAAMC